MLRDGMPSAAGTPYEVLALEHGVAVLRLTTGPEAIRPGGTVSGPVLFAFADLAMYAAVMSVVGKLPLAVTTDATIHFLRKPLPGALVARARILKQGKRLVIGDVMIHDEGDDAAVAHVVMTYSVPPR
ncbi:MAG TPA: PaaI family thioesterase [Kofleriaceae bacterium]